MANRLVVVKAVEWSDLPGLNAEAETLEALIDKLPGAARDLLEEVRGNDEREAPNEVPIESIAHASTLTRMRDAA